jgi:hypothetical protein
MKKVFFVVSFLLILKPCYCQEAKQSESIILDKGHFIYKGKRVGETRIISMLRKKQMNEIMVNEIHKETSLLKLHRFLLILGGPPIIMGGILFATSVADNKQKTATIVGLGLFTGGILIEVGAILVKKKQKKRLNKVVDLYNQSLLN